MIDTIIITISVLWIVVLSWFFGACLLPTLAILGVRFFTDQQKALCILSLMALIVIFLVLIEYEPYFNESIIRLISYYYSEYRNLFINTTKIVVSIVFSPFIAASVIYLVNRIRSNSQFEEISM